MTAVLTTLVSFNDPFGPFSPESGVIADANGDLFGTTPEDFADDNGTVFEIVNHGTASSPSYASTPTILVSFGGSNGAHPVGSLIADANGDLFGTAQNGGASGLGTVFEIVNHGTASSPSYASTPTTLVSFGGSNGANPVGSLIADANGDLFGTTQNGGTSGLGTVFEIVNHGTASSPSYASTPTTLVSFGGSNGANPVGSLMADANGDLFGTTQNGGASDNGTVFEIVNHGTASSPSYASTPTTLVSFGGSNGAFPAGSLIANANGDLFGTTGGGGPSSSGTVFEIVNHGTASSPSYASTPTTLVSFDFSNGNGANPESSLIADANGDLFGTTSSGGASGGGTVFEIVNHGTASSPSYDSTPTTLVSFDRFNGDGANPFFGSLIADANGDLFGTTQNGGAGDSAGTVFEITSSGFGLDLQGTLSTNSPVEGSAISLTTVTDDGYDVHATATYQWMVNTGSSFVDATGTGATTATYTPTESDEGGTLEVVITYAGDSSNDSSNPNGAETTTVVATNPVQESPTENAAISLTGLTSGNAVEGTTVTATVTEADAPTSGITYTWKVNGSTVKTGVDAAGNTYTPTETDEGLPISVTVSFTDTNGNVETGTKSAGSVQESPTEDAAISLTGLTSGNAAEGTTVTATVTEADAPTSGITYTWKVNGSTVKTGVDGAGNAYTPTDNDEGLPIRVTVSFTDTNGNAETGTKSAGAVQESPTENAAFTVTGLVAGHPVPNHPLTATVTEPDAPNSGISYTWIVNGVTKQSSTSNTYTPQPGDAAKPLTVTVSFTDTHGFAETGTQNFGNVGSNAHYDLNGDGVSDLVFQNNGQPGIWLWNGMAPTAEVGLTNPGASWHIITSRDVNGDGNADLIWQNSDGTAGIWLMNGTAPIAEAGLTNPGASWKLVAAGDVNGDSRADLLWQDISGSIGVWEMNGTTPIAEAAIAGPGPNWKMIGAADFNGDSRDDILFQNSTTGNLMIDLMNGTSVTSSVSINVGDPSWHAVSTGVFNGQAEIAWQNTNGTVGLWLMNGTTPAAEAGLPNPGSGWQLVSMDHFTPNGQADLLFQNSTTDAMQLWETNGTSIVAQVNLPNPGAGWILQNGHPFASG